MKNWKKGYYVQHFIYLLYKTPTLSDFPKSFRQNHLSFMCRMIPLKSMLILGHHGYCFVDKLPSSADHVIGYLIDSIVWFGSSSPALKWEHVLVELQLTLLHSISWYLIQSVVWYVQRYFTHLPHWNGFPEQNQFVEIPC